MSGVTELPPFGLIFSCFMSAMMMGSMIFSSIELRSERDTGRLLLSILALAAISLLLPVLATAEALAFWCFSLFEACVGLYFPTMSRLKSELVEDAVRGKVYGMMRLPLNVFVVLALGVTREGKHSSGTRNGNTLMANRRRSSWHGVHFYLRLASVRLLCSPEMLAVGVSTAKGHLPPAATHSVFRACLHLN